MNAFNVIVSLLTLFFAMAGFFRGLYGSKYSIDLEHVSLKVDRRLWFLAFTVANRSLRPIKVSKLCFYANGDSVNTRDFDPQAFDEQQEEVERQSEKLEREKEPVPFGFPKPMDPSVFERPLHSPLEYSFYKPIEMPCIIHGDTEKEFSYYFSSKPDRLTIQFDRRMILSFKWFLIPQYASSISINLDSEKTTES